MNSDESNFYKRHLLLPEIGASGQTLLKNSSVLVIGAGGLGCPILQYLSAAGIGRIGILDGDNIEASNLHRQILFYYQDIGKNKANVACSKLQSLNPYIEIKSYPYYLNEDNAFDLFSKYDIIVDGTDNFYAKYLTNDIAYKLDKPVVYGSISQFDGQLTVFGKSYKGIELSGVNLRDLYPEPPPILLSENCSESGVLGVLPGLVGTMQALETIKLITHITGFESGVLHYFSGKSLSLDSYKISLSNSNILRNGDDQVIDYSAFKTCDIDIECDFEVSNYDEFCRIDNSKYQIIDVRSYTEHSARPLGECCIPLNTLSVSLKLFDTTREILFICSTGLRSKKAAMYAKNEFNLECRSIKGGIGDISA